MNRTIPGDIDAGSTHYATKTLVLNPPYTLLALGMCPLTIWLAGVLGPYTPYSQPPWDLALPQSGLAPVPGHPGSYC